MEAATRGMEEVEDPSPREQEVATHNEEEASSTETTGEKDVAEREMHTRAKTRAGGSCMTGIMNVA